MSGLIHELTALLPEGAVLVGDDVRQRPTNWLGYGQCEARALVRPGSTEELARVMRVCNAHGQTVVVQGGNTGLVGGSLAVESDVVVSLERMARIESFSAVENTVVVQAGIKLQALQEFAEDHGRFFPLDLGARGSCTIGGNIATNAGGNRVIRFGMMRDQVLGLEVVLSDGTILSALNTLQKNNTGYDLKQLFIGSEGTLGIVTRAVLRVQPRPASHQVVLVAVADFSALLPLLQLMRESLWGTLSAFEVMWQDFYTAVTEHSERHRRPLTADYPCYALIESLGADPERDSAAFEASLFRAQEAGLIAASAIARSAVQRQELWAIREETASLVRSFTPYYAFDVSLPLEKTQGYIAELRQRLEAQWPSTGRLLAFGHLGDGNIHVVLTVGRADSRIRRALEALVYEPLAQVCGSVSAEHGIGIDKLDYLQLTRTQSEVDMMRAVKRTLDPKNLLNRGKLLASGAETIASTSPASFAE